MPRPAERELTIGLDARVLHRENRRGIGKTLADLYQQLLKVRPDWRVVGYVRDRADLDSFTCSRYQARAVGMPGDRFHAWERWRLPLVAWRDGADVLHCPANTCPTWNPVPTVVTIHDLLPLDATIFDSHRFRQSVEHAVKASLTITTPSRYTADQLRTRFDAGEGQLSVIPWAADARMQYVASAGERAQIAAKYGIRGPFILHLGAADSRKNTRTLLRAYAALPANLRDRWKLLVIGIDNPVWMEELYGQLAALGCRRQVFLHPYAPADDLPTLFSAAGVLAYPSRAEGFGLPILDAWATNTPVLTSNVTSLPEVAGDAAVLVDPLDVFSISRGLRKLVTELRLREELVRRGTRRLARHSWIHSAELFAGVIEHAARVRKPLSQAA